MIAPKANVSLYSSLHLVPERLVDLHA
jgi:hypothetical protein